MLKSSASTCVYITILIYYTDTVFASETESDKGLWTVKHMEKCPGYEAYPIQIDVVKRKVNRTHDGIIGHIDVDKDITDQHGIRADVCKHVDGGCKDFYVLSESSICGFCEKFAKGNLERMLAPYDRLLPLCPITAGRHELTELFVFDYEELPEDGMYGSYDVLAYVLAGGIELGCVKLTVDFNEKLDLEDDE